jgi:hypothetical protein
VLQATGRARLDKSASRDQVLGILKESLTHV